MSAFFRVFAYGSATLAIALLVGCSTSESVDLSPTEAAPTVAEPTATAPATTAPATGRIRLRADQGAATLLLKVQPQSATVEGENGSPALELVKEADQVQVNAADGTTLAVVTTEADQWTVSAGQPAEGATRYVLQRLNGGDYQLTTADGADIYRIQKRGYGFEITAPDDTSLYKLRLKGERLVLRDAAAQLLWATNDPLVPAAMLPFAFEELTPEQQVGLAYAIHQAGG